MSKSTSPFQRAQAHDLARRLAEPRRFIQVVAGPRQVGKTTLVQQVTKDVGVPVRFASADEPTLRGAQWIAEQWEAARLTAGAGVGGAILVLDEVQKAGRLVGIGEASLGRGHQGQTAAQGDPPRLRAAPRSAGAHRQPP